MSAEEASHRLDRIFKRGDEENVKFASLDRNFSRESLFSLPRCAERAWGRAENAWEHAEGAWLHAESAHRSAESAPTPLGMGCVVPGHAASLSDLVNYPACVAGL